MELHSETRVDVSCVNITYMLSSKSAPSKLNRSLDDPTGLFFGDLGDNGDERGKCKSVGLLGSRSCCCSGGGCCLSNFWKNNSREKN